MAKEGYHTWQYPDAEIDKLADPKIKAAFFVNPSNPASVADRAKAACAAWCELVKTKRPDLMILTDDVYGTFVDHFRSLMAELPHNTIGVYSYSKYFGCTGWRLGVIAIHQKQRVSTRSSPRCPPPRRKALNQRYGTLTLQPEKLKFIDRMVADSRQVALNHTAGLSLPQQVQMALFSLFALLDQDDRYKKLTQQIVQRRLRKLAEGVDVTLWDDPHRTGYYFTIDLRNWALHEYGPEFEKLLDHLHPYDALFALAERAGIVLLNGSGFAAPDWSVRVSLANLDDAAYEQIGRELRALMTRAGELWREQQAKATKPRARKPA